MDVYVSTSRNILIQQETYMKLQALILAALMVAGACAFAQESTNAPTRPQRPAMSEMQRGPRGPQFRGGQQFQQRGPQSQQRGQVAPNDSQENWNQTLEARRSESLNKLNPSGPYPRPQFRGPQFRGGQQRQQVIVIQIQLPDQQSQRGPQFRGGQRGHGPRRG